MSERHRVPTLIGQLLAYIDEHVADEFTIGLRELKAFTPGEFDAIHDRLSEIKRIAAGDDESLSLSNLETLLKLATRFRDDRVFGTESSDQRETLAHFAHIVERARDTKRERPA